MESRVSNREANFDEFKKSQEEFRISQAKFRAEIKSTGAEIKTTQDLILLQLKLLAAKLGVESSAATPTHQPFIKSTSPFSLEKSNEIVLKLQSFHKEKVRAREKVDEFLSQYRPKYKPKSPPCMRPILKRFKKVLDYGKHHDDDSATFRSNRRFQVSFGFSLKALARENEKVFDLFDKEAKDSVKSPPFLDSDRKIGTTNDLVSGFPVFDREFIGIEKKVAASKLLAKKGEDSLLCDVGLCSFPEVGSFPEVVLISIAKSGENDAHHVFVGLQQTVDIASLKLGFHEFTRDKGGTTIQRLFNSKSATVLEYDCKNGKSQVFILEIHVSNVEFKKAQLPGSRALYLFDKMSNSGYILDIKLGYHMSIRDKGGTNFLSSFESIDLLASCKDSGFCVVINHSMGCYCKGIRDKGGGLPKDNIWRDHLRIFRYKISTIFSSYTKESENAIAYNNNVADEALCLLLISIGKTNGIVGNTVLRKTEGLPIERAVSCQPIWPLVLTHKFPNNTTTMVVTFVFTTVIGALFAEEERTQIHRVGVQVEFLCKGSIHVSRVIMHLYSRCGNKHNALKFFLAPDLCEITEPNNSWNYLLAGSFESRSTSQAVQVGIEMYGVVVCIVALVILLHAGYSDCTVHIIAQFWRGCNVELMFSTLSSLEKTFSAVSYFKGAMLLRLKYELANDCAGDDDAKPVISELRKAVRQELKMHDSFVMEWGLEGAKEAPINYAVKGVKGLGKIATPFERTKVTLSQMLGFCKMYQCNLGQKNVQESDAATEALVNGKTTQKMMLHGNYTVN